MERKAKPWWLPRLRVRPLTQPICSALLEHLGGAGVIPQKGGIWGAHKQHSWHGEALGADPLRTTPPLPFGLLLAQGWTPLDTSGPRTPPSPS